MIASASRVAVHDELSQYDMAPTERKPSADDVLVRFVRGKSVQGMRLCFALGSIADAISEDGVPVVMCALGSPHRDMLALLVAKGADLDAVDAYGMTSVMRAACFGYRDALKLLADKGANLRIVDKLGRDAACHAANSGDRRALAIIEKALARNRRAHGNRSWLRPVRRVWTLRINPAYLDRGGLA